MVQKLLPMLFTAVALFPGAAAGAGQVEFNRDIRPVLADTCFQCHGPDPDTRKADLRLDLEEGYFTAEEDEPPLLVKGKPEESEVYLRLITSDEDDVMPPPDSHKEVTPEQIELIRQWIEEGAPWQTHWSLVAPTRPEVPAVTDEAWARTPVDRFILARLEAEGLAPAPEADPRTLARRVALDLTGLPPEPELVEAFAADPSDAGWERLVDTLLASKHYGEHRGRYWLDAARYGDTHGLHFDNYREIWPYRDWVIAAFNANQPFDRFTVEQLAGDLLPEPTLEQRVATGFQRCNITTNEGGTIVEENLANYAADRVQTMGWVFMGLTINCCQCHDHKFDPITMRDFYSMAAFFRNTTQGGLDGNVKDGRGPAIAVPVGEDRQRWDSLPGLIATAATERDRRREEARADFDEWLASARPGDLEASLPSEGLAVHVPLDEGAGSAVHGALDGAPATFQAGGDVAWVPDGKLGPAPVVKAAATFDLGGAGDFEADQPFSWGAWVKAGPSGATGGIIARMDEADAYRGWDLFQQDRKLAVHLVHQWPDDALKVATAEPVLKPGEWQHVFVTWNGSRKPDGVRLYVDGVAQALATEKATLKPESSIRTGTPLRLGGRSGNQAFEGGALQDARLYTRELSSDEVAALAAHGPLVALLKTDPAARTPEQHETLYHQYLTAYDPRFLELQDAVARLESEREAIRARSPVTHVQEERRDSKPVAKILMRGQYDRPGEEVAADTPAALPPMPEGAPRNRLGLAQWVVDPANPLTARVTVNRFWQQLFGRGIVETPEDLGVMGSPPTHPELLDWLAVEFVESGWDVKGLIRRMVSSATYRQAAVATPEKIEKDPGNRLLSRGPRFRMDAEMVRDYALAASGLLSPKMGGPGTRPYQPPGVWDVVGLPGGDTRNYVQDTGENLYRRSVYHFWKRMAPPPSLEVFNAPSREVCTVRRERTNTPLQALVTMNDPQFVEAARHLAQHALAAAGGAAAGDACAPALDEIARRVLCRPLKPRETELLAASLGDLLGHYRAHPDDARALLAIGESPVDETLDPSALAAWTMLCNEVLNLDEVLNK